ncbi:MAG: F0F1 ATP synthase subunit B [Lautropia sp.]
MTIDWWTLGIQAVNVLVLIGLLGRFFWRPLSAMIDARRDAVRAQLEAVRRDREAAGAERERAAADRAALAAARDAALVQARAEAAREKAMLIGAAQAEADALVGAAAGRIDAEREAATATMQHQAVSLAIDVARRLAGRLDGAVVHAAFLQWLVDAIAGLPKETRAAVVTEDMVLEAIAATPLGDEGEALCRDRVARAFGGPVRLVFRTDPALVAGLELRGPHFVVANSWRADLEAIRRSLGG